MNRRSHSNRCSSICSQSGATTPFQTLAFGDIPSTGFAQSFEDLSSLIVGTDLSQALLRLTFGDTPLTATLFASSLNGDPQTLLATSVDIQTTAPVSGAGDADAPREQPRRHGMAPPPQAAHAAYDEPASRRFTARIVFARLSDAHERIRSRD